jgi:flagellar protein FliL
MQAAANFGGSRSPAIFSCWPNIDRDGEYDMMNYKRSMARLAAFCLVAGLSLTTADTQAEEKSGAGSDAGYVQLEPFVSNLADSGDQRYLQITVGVKGARPDTADNVKMFMPMVRHVIILLLCEKTSAELLTLKGKSDLMEAIKAGINQQLGLDKEHGITEVAFTTFVVQ